MKGLMKEDLYILLNSGPLFFAIFYTLVIVYLFDGSYFMAFGLGTFLPVVMLTKSIIQTEAWGSLPYLFTLPVTRRTYVLEKYCLPLLSALLSVLIIGAVSLLRGLPLGEMLEMAVMSVGMILPYLVVFIPLMLKVGQNASYFMVFFVAGAMLLLAFFGDGDLPTLPQWTGWAAGLAMLAALPASMLISTRILKHKDL